MHLFLFVITPRQNLSAINKTVQYILYKKSESPASFLYNRQSHIAKLPIYICRQPFVRHSTNLYKHSLHFSTFSRMRKRLLIQHLSLPWLPLLFASSPDLYIPCMYLKTYPVPLYWLYVPDDKSPKKQDAHIRQPVADKANHSNLYIYCLLHNNLRKQLQAANYILLSFDSIPR